MTSGALAGPPPLPPSPPPAQPLRRDLRLGDLGDLGDPGDPTPARLCLGGGGLAARVLSGPATRLSKLAPLQLRFLGAEGDPGRVPFPARAPSERRRAANKGGAGRGARGRASARLSGRRRRRRARARIPPKRPEPAGLRHPPAPPPSLPEQSNSWRTGAASSEPWRAAAAAARRRERPRRPRGSLAPAEQGKVPAGGWGPPARAPRGPAGTPVVDFAAILRAALGKAA